MRSIRIDAEAAGGYGQSGRGVWSRSGRGGRLLFLSSDGGDQLSARSPCSVLQS